MEMFIEFESLMHKGGPVMWVIFVSACLAIIMLLIQGLRLIRLTKNARRDYSTLVLNQDVNLILADARLISPVAQLLDSVNIAEVRSKEELIKVINTHLVEITPRLEGTLPTVAVIGTLLPMLGLLGTVTGMISVFEVIAIQGAGDPGEMAHGISQALLTTASGLIIAIPVIFAHHVLARRMEVLMAITQQAIQIVLHKFPVALEAKAKS